MLFTTLTSHPRVDDERKWAEFLGPRDLDLAVGIDFRSSLTAEITRDVSAHAQLTEFSTDVSWLEFSAKRSAWHRCLP